MLAAWTGRTARWKGRLDLGGATARATVLALVLVTTAATAAALPRLTGFTLRDQFDQPHTLAFPRAGIAVLTIADNAGSKQLDPWVTAIEAQFGDRVDYLGVANVAGVPGPLQPWLKSRFRKTLDHPVLLDWRGEVIRAAAPVRGVANLYVLGRDGELLAHTHGALAPDKLTNFSNALHAALAAAPATPALPGQPAVAAGSAPPSPHSATVQENQP